jgi:hypothetical protein
MADHLLRSRWKQRQRVDDKQSAGNQQKQEQENQGERYLCNKCYMTGPEAMPEGYEDVTNLRDTRARMKELGH